MKIGIMRVMASIVAGLGVLCLLSFALQDKALAQTYWQGQDFFGRSILVSADLIDGKLHVVKRTPSNITYCNGGSPPDSITKYIYAASNGVVVLERTVEGTVVPPSVTPEKIEWPDAESKKFLDPWKQWGGYTNLVALGTNNVTLTNSQDFIYLNSCSNVATNTGDKK